MQNVESVYALTATQRSILPRALKRAAAGAYVGQLSGEGAIELPAEESAP